MEMKDDEISSPASGGSEEGTTPYRYHYIISLRVCLIEALEGVMELEL